MDERKKFIELAIDSFVGFDEDTGKHCCEVCGKLYQMSGHLRKHILREHHSRVVLKAAQLEEKNQLDEVVFLHRHIFGLVPEAWRRRDEKIQIAMEKIANGDISFRYFADHYAEEVIIAEEEMHLLEGIRHIMETGDNYKDMYVELCTARDDLRESVIADLPRHNSTGEMVNITERLKHQAMANLVKNSYIKGFLCQLIYYFDKLTNRVDQLSE